MRSSRGLAGFRILREQLLFEHRGYASGQGNGDCRAVGDVHGAEFWSWHQPLAIHDFVARRKRRFVLPISAMAMPR